MHVEAAKISETEAVMKAERLMPHKKFKSHAVSLTEKRKTKRSAVSYTNFHVVNAEDGGFVIVSGDDRTPEILGYSEHGSLDLSSVPENVKWLLDSYENLINGLSESDDPVYESANPAKEAIAPMIATSWGQGSPYNSMCPTLGAQCVTGSMATAMAQVINFCKWPTAATKEIGAYTTSTNKIEMPQLEATTFDWDNITDDDVSRLMLYCGQAVNTDYGTETSGAKLLNVPTAMRTIFHYANSLHPESRSNYTDKEWESLLYDELLEQRPILYSGKSGSEDQMFICHGYKDGYFYINWGWNGDCDGYFNLSIINPSRYSVSNNQTAIVGIQKTIYNELDEDERTAYYDDPERHLFFTLHLDTQEAILGEEFPTEEHRYTALSNAGLEWNDFSNYWEHVDVPAYITYRNKKYTVVGVAPRAFYRTTQVHTVKLPETIQYIGSEAFNSCVKLESVNIPSQVRMIEANTFKLCYQELKSIHLPEGLDSIASGAFIDCSALKEINIPGTCKGIGEDAFTGCTKLSTLIIEDGTEPLRFSCSNSVSFFYQSTWENKDDLKPHLRGQFGDCPLSHIYLGRNVEYPVLYYDRTKKNRVFPPFERCSEYSQYGVYPYTFSGPRLQTLEFGETLTEIADSLFTGEEDGARIYGKIEFPKSLKTIGRYAFAKALNYWLDSDPKNKKLVIPENVVSIGYCAFRDDNIDELILPNTALVIEAGAFENSNIRELTIPESATGIYGFDGNPLRLVHCNTLTPPAESNPFSDAAIFVQQGRGKAYRQQWPNALIIDDTDDIISINVRTAGTLYSRLIAQEYQTQDVCKLKLKGTLNSDDVNVINSMSNLYYLDLFEMEVEETPTGLFQSIPNLVDIKLPSTLKVIHEKEFTGCIKLSGTIQLPPSCSVIGKNAFNNTSIDGLMYSGAITIGDSAFINCFRLSDVDINDNTVVGAYAFQGTRIPQIAIGTGSTIKTKAFWECGLKDVTLADGVESIEDLAFGIELEKITFMGNVNAIGDIFYSTISKVYVSDISTWCQLPFAKGGPMEYSPQLYINNEEVKDVIIPKTVNSIRDYLFYGCTSLNSVEISEGINAIGTASFKNCANLTSAALPSTLTSIGASAFQDCNKLASVTLPATLSSIGASAFSGCSNITNITLPSTLSVINSNVFEGCTSLTKLDLPSSITAIKSNAFASCTSLQRVVAHWDNPITIQDNAFGITSECYLYCPIGTATKYFNAGWNIFSNLKEAGILTVIANKGGVVSCYDTAVTDNTEDVFYTPYKSFNISLTPDEGYVIKKVKLNGENVTSQVEDGILFMEEPEENMTLSVVFADANIRTGDVNGDGVVNVTDAICIVNYILKNQPNIFYEYAADTNDDDVINVTDAIILISKNIK